jgi:hypothetical protein
LQFVVSDSFCTLDRKFGIAVASDDVGTLNESCTGHLSILPSSAHLNLDCREQEMDYAHHCRNLKEKRVLAYVLLISGLLGRSERIWSQIGSGAPDA